MVWKGGWTSMALKGGQEWGGKEDARPRGEAARTGICVGGRLGRGKEVNPVEGEKEGNRERKRQLPHEEKGMGSSLKVRDRRWALEGIV